MNPKYCRKRNDVLIFVLVAILVICRSGAWWPWCMMGYGGDSGSRCGEGVGDGGVGNVVDGDGHTVL